MIKKYQCRRLFHIRVINLKSFYYSYSKCGPLIKRDLKTYHTLETLVFFGFEETVTALGHNQVTFLKYLTNDFVS